MLATVVIGAALLVPLVVRGPVLRRLVQHESESLCGSISLVDGRLGWAAVPNLLLRRPVRVTLDQVRIQTPDGHEVLEAARITASIEVHWRQRHFVIDAATLEHGHVEVAIAKPHRPPRLVEALRKVPAAGRLVCFDGAAPDGSSKAAAGAGSTSNDPSGRGVVLDIRRLHLRDVDLELEFLDWAVSLSGLDAAGSFSVAKSAAILFDTRDATARRGGWLRIGKEGTAAAVRQRFDEVTLAHVAIAQQSPTDLLVEIVSAFTGRSRLSGRAVVHDVVTARHASPPGRHHHHAVDLDVRWERIGDALAAMEAQWLPPHARRPRMDGTFEASLRGPFVAPLGKVRMDIGPLHFAADLEGTGDLDTDLLIDRVDTNPFLEPALRPLLGGHLAGHVHLQGHLAPKQADRRAVLREADLSLERSQGGPWPQHLAIRVRSPSRAPAPASTDARTVLLTLAGARLDGPTLRVEGLDVRTVPLRLHGSLLARLPVSQARPSTTLLLDEVKAHFDISAPSLASLLPDSPLRGAVRMSLVLEGDPNRLAARVAFREPRTISVWRQGFTLPAQVKASVSEGETLTIPPIVVTHVGGGSVDASAQLMLDGTATKASLHLRDFPAGDLPGLERVKVPPFLGTASAPAGTLRDALRGRLNGALLLRGSSAHPTVDGELTIGNARFAGRSVGEGRLRLHALADRLSFEGALGPSIAFDGWASRRVRKTTSSAAVTLRLRALRLRPWLPAPWAALNVSATGQVTASVTKQSPPEIRGAVRLDGTGGTFRVEGRVEDSTLQVALTGRLDAAAFADPLRRVGRPSGHVAIAAQISGTVAKPTVEGEMRVDAKVRPARREVPPLHVVGAVEMHGETVSTRDLRIEVTEVGTLAIGRADHPATVQLGPLWPPTRWPVDVPVSAHGLAFKQPTSRLSIEGLDIDLRLLGRIGGDLSVRGAVELAHAAYNLSGPAVKPKAKPKPSSSRRPWYESLPPRLTLDLTLRAPRHAMTVEIPYVPDVTIELECHLIATSRGATLSGRLQGDAPFSRAAVAVFDWLKPADVRACQLLSL